ncbi:oxidoreductase [Vibrio sp. 2-2(8)]|uniref:oxidoreductase n=1 Tax=Vibrio sp. 2-2(8) TaxID=2591014 RepID=UPI001482C4D9|nr:oxidoreductase [Vibrio sp. 2-2(8)]NNN48629.1 SDR family oxidoreductase [Vibrio sp. 2-2(8)]
MYSLEKYKTIVFGANGLLGLKVTNAILDRGGEVVAVDYAIEGLKDKLSHSVGGRVTVVQLDVTNQTEVIAFFDSLDDDITGAVNCTYPRNSSYGAHFFDVSLDSFNENISMHLGSAFLIAQQSAKHFIKNKKLFSLVNISSVYGVIAPKFDIYDNTPMTMPVEYAAIKSAIIHLNKYISKYVSASSFRVNSVSPGGIFDNQPESFCLAYRDNTNGAGMLDVSEMIGSILFLLSSDSRYITGQNLIVDDGFSL